MDVGAQRAGTAPAKIFVGRFRQHNQERGICANAVIAKA